MTMEGLTKDEAIAAYRETKRDLAKFKRSNLPGTCTRGYVIRIGELADILKVHEVDFWKLHGEVEAELKAEGLGPRTMGETLSGNG